MAVFRLVKSSNTAIPKSEPRIDWTVRTAEHLQNHIKVDTQEAPRFTHAEIARTSDEFSSVTGDNTKVSTVPATLPEKTAAGEPVQQDAKSTLVSFEFGQGMELSANNQPLFCQSIAGAWGCRVQDYFALFAFLFTTGMLGSGTTSFGHSPVLDLG